MQLQSEIEVDEEVCVIFNDGTKSTGCEKPEFKTYVSN
jgi:hypothetical protein